MFQSSEVTVAGIITENKQLFFMYLYFCVHSVHEQVIFVCPVSVCVFTHDPDAFNQPHSAGLNLERHLEG